MKNNKHEVRKAVCDAYSNVVRESVNEDTGCRTVKEATCCAPAEKESYTESAMKAGYSPEDLKLVPTGANLGLSCGNPHNTAILKAGETVLDLGCGAGFDVFLASKAVGNDGKVIGVDMLPEMISRARQLAEEGEYANVEFRLGEIEHLPVLDNSIDVIMSNCVINLSPEKQKVFHEAYRALKPGGRISYADIVATAELPEEIRNDMRLHASCVSGASPITELRNMLETEGFERIEITPQEPSKLSNTVWKKESRVEDFVLVVTVKALKKRR